MRNSVFPPGSQYQVAVATGNIAAGAGSNSVVFSARWGSSTKIAVVTYIGIPGMRAPTAFVAGITDIKATIARGFTVAHTGGTALDLTGNNNKLRTSMPTSLFSDMRVASTAALGGGTLTLDAQDVGIIVTSTSSGFAGATPIIGSQYIPDMVLFDANLSRGDMPIVLATNEGVVVRATVPGTGVWNLGVEMHWFECDPSVDF